MYNKNKRIHFIGIGGIGMSGIAEVLANLGYVVSGSDVKESGITRRLATLGITVHKGHSPQWVKKADVVVVSTAIRQDNPERAEAEAQNMVVIPRAEMLAELMRLQKFGIAIAGSHGKTTTTSITGWLLAQAGLDPTVIIGGKVDSFGSNAKLGAGDFLVAEADESDGSFLRLSPVIEAVTNIDLEHVDFYKDLDEIKETFLQFIHKIPFYGAVVLCLDDPVIADILPQINKRTITYGHSAQADVQARGTMPFNGGSRFELIAHGTSLGEITVPLAGKHNVANCLAAAAIGIELGVKFSVLSEALSSFSGVQRRMQVKGVARGITVIDDYGHHPTEIRATLEALRSSRPKGRLVVIFQPHRYSRTKGLFEQFLTSFYQADILVMTDIYPAGEPPIEGITSEALVEGLCRHGQHDVIHVAKKEDLAKTVIPLLKQDDTLLTLGAGDIFRTGEVILQRLNT